VAGGVTTIEPKQSDDARRVWALSVHDTVDTGGHADLRHIVEAMGSLIDAYTWAVVFLDCMGEGTEQICDQVASAAEAGKILTLNAEELRRVVQAITQTVDAAILGVPRGERDPEETIQMAHSGHFLQSRAEVLLYVADNAVYAVITKQRKHVDVLRAGFTYIRDEDPADFG
jgi:hypothetical protein